MGWHDAFCESVVYLPELWFWAFVYKSLLLESRAGSEVYTT